MIFILGIYAIAVLYLIIRLVVRANGFFVRKYHDNSYAVFSSRLMLAGVSMFLFGTALEFFMKIIS